MSDSIYYGTAANPSAGGTVVTSAALTTGHYQVTVTTQAAGTVTSADLNNVQLQVGGSTIGTLLMPAIAAGPYRNPPVTLSVPSSTPVLVTAVGNASGSTATYNTQMVVSPVAIYSE